MNQHPQAWRNLAWATVILLVLTLLWDASNLDLRVMSWLADRQGFSLRHEWWLEHVLHDAMRNASTVAFVITLVLLAWPKGPAQHWPRWQRLAVATGMSLGLLAINAIKRNSLTSCPWDLRAFGGVADHVSHWSWGLADGGGGHCFPGGHASAAFIFLALAMPWLTAAAPAARQRGQRVLFTVVLFGLLLGVTQTVRGAHYPSHTLWTALICWTVALMNHAFFVALAYKHTQRTTDTGMVIQRI